MAIFNPMSKKYGQTNSQQWKGHEFFTDKNNRQINNISSDISIYKLRYPINIEESRSIQKMLNKPFIGQRQIYQTLSKSGNQTLQQNSYKIDYSYPFPHYDQKCVKEKTQSETLDGQEIQGNKEDQKIEPSFENISISNQKVLINEILEKSEEKINSVNSLISDEFQTDSDSEIMTKNIPLCLILGQAATGKTFIMKKIFGTSEEMELFKPQLLWKKKIKYNFVDTSSFDFENDYDSREEQIANYQGLFKEHPNKIRSILIVVNFERTDLMKNKVLAILKYFGNFKKLISLIITHFHLSQNIEEDKKHLKNSFSFVQANDIIFVGKDTESEELLKNLKENSLQSLEREYKFDLNDTIFENEDEEEQIQFIKELERNLNKLS